MHHLGEGIGYTDKLAVWGFHGSQAGQQEVEEFLKSALPLAQAEAGTTAWYALKNRAVTLRHFNTFAHSGSRQAHLPGEITKALIAKADDLFAKPPQLDIDTEIPAAKVPTA